ncbi:hypothetical protein CEXT_306451, partial [Caerostris extrusa]
MCNCTITNFNNHKCHYDEHPFDRIVSEVLDYNFGSIHQEKPATISHLAEGTDFNSMAFMKRTSTFQYSTFPQSHCDANRTADTNVRYASNNKIQNENFDYFNSSQGLTFPAAQTFESSDCTFGVENHAMAFSTAASTTTLNTFKSFCNPATQQFENSDCTSGVENPAMPFFNAAYTSELNRVEVPWTNSSVFMHQCPNLPSYNQLPQNYLGPSNHLTMYDPTKENYNISMNVESRQCGMQDFEISHFQDEEYDAVSTARKSNRTEKNKSCASHLNSASLNVQYHGDPHTKKKSREKIQPCPKIAQARDESSVRKLRKTIKPRVKRQSCNIC